MCKLKHLAVAAAIVGLATQVQAGYFPGSTDFEDIDLTTSDYWSAVGDATIETVATVTPAGGRATYRPSWFSTTNKVLSVDNDVDSPIICNINGGAAMPTNTIYADALVTGAPLANDASVPEVGQTDKIIVYTRVNAAGTDTNLCVLARPAANSQTNEFVLTKSIGKDEWHRIVIKASNGAYQVFCDDVNTPCTDGTVSTFYPIAAVNQGSASMSSVAFAGTGSVDDLILSNLIPEQPVYTLTWGEGFQTVSYTVNGVAGDSLTAADGRYEFQAAAGATIVLTGNTGYRSFEASGVGFASPIVLPGQTGIAKFFPLSATAGQDGTAAHPYEIPDIVALNALKDAVLETNCVNLCFVQTANIDMASAGPWAGIGEYAANLNSGHAFSGTYDGQGYKISNVDFTQRNYGGIFNQVKGGTIKNLIVENITCSTFVSGEWGCAIVGNAGMGATLQNLEARGDFGTAAIPCSHNVAGIAIRVCGGASNVVDGVVMLETLIKDCTNNAALHGNYTKLGGMSALTQDQNGVPNDYVLYDGCVNNGTITATANANGKNPGVDGIAGIVGYSGDATQLKDCVNNATYSSVYASAKTAELVANHTSKELTDLGGNKGDAAKKFVNTASAANLIGFKYATVDNGVATTIPPPYTLAAGNTYLLLGNVAASETPVATLTTAGSTIAFDTALGYTFAGTVAAAAPLLLTSSTSGTVTTYSTGFFPRTATAGQDGSAEHPFEIADLDDLEALQAAVANAPAIYAGLSYVQTADIALTNAWEGIGVKGGKDLVNHSAGTSAQVIANDLETYVNEAFSGTYDGGNFTISNFQMENGTDYGALFNSVNGATIKNLKITWGATTLCANSSSSGGDTGATFVGVARGSTLSNLTALAGANVVVYASKDFGGIVGYLMAGSTVDSCTNELNVASLNGSRKCGGIAIITQSGSGTATLRNCKNSGTSNGGNQDGAIVGYIGTTTAIIGCENTANAPLLTCQSGTVTVSGGTKSVAYRTPFVMNGGTVNGLNFAIVDGDVATFVEDNALAAGNTYKVMADGATATYNFTAPGTIAFDTELATPTAYAITAAQGLTLTDATSGNVKTYTASIAAATWIGGAQGNWEIASNWSGGFVPTADTIVTFTNDCAVGIYRDSGHCKEIVLDGAAMTFVAAAQGDYSGSVHMHFHGNNGSAVSGSGTLGVNNISLFNANYSGALTIATGINVLGPVTFKGNHANGTTTAGSFTVTGNTAAANGVEIKTIDYSTTTFSGNISVPAGATVTFHSFSNGHTVIAAGSTATLATASGTATTLVLNGDVTMNGAVVPDDPVGYTVERTTSGNTVTYTTAVAAPAYPTYLENADANIKAAYDTWKVTNGPDTESAFEKQFLLDTAPATVVPDNALVITAIAQNATAGWDITVGSAVQGVSLTGTVGTARVCNGYLAVVYTDNLTGTWTAENINITAVANGQVTVNVNKAGAQFMKVKLSVTQEPAAVGNE